MISTANKPFLVKESLELLLEDRFKIVKDWDFSCVRKRVMKYTSPDFDIDKAIEEYQNWISNSKFRTILRHFSDQSKY